MPWRAGGSRARSPATWSALAAALATARDWPILLEMQAEGAYPTVLWQYANAVAGKGDVPGGKKGITVNRATRTRSAADQGPLVSRFMGVTSPRLLRQPGRTD